jgi:dephospho-CoA kinase
MLHVGLTGGIACGKSTVARMLGERGALLIDFDALARRVLEPGGEVYREVIRAFGEEMLAADGRIDRGRLGAVVFADGGKREILNGLVHPAVLQAWRQRLGEIGSDRSGVVVSDIPLLFEAGLEGQVDLVVLVYLPPEEQARRLMARNGFDRAEALRRMAAQMPIDRKVPLADLVIDNGGSLARTAREVDRVWGELCRRPGSGCGGPLPGPADEDLSTLRSAGRSKKEVFP